MYEPPRCAAWQCSRHELTGCTCGVGERCSCTGPPPPSAEAGAERAAAHKPEDAGDRRSLGSTTRGKHNLNMVGDMPVAEKRTTELFNALDAALQSGAQPSAMRAAYELARHLGAEKPRIATQNAVVAAFIMVKHPQRYTSVTAAAKAHSASTFAIAGWKIRIADAAKRVARARSAHDATKTQIDGGSRPAGTTAQAEAALVAAADELEEQLSATRHSELSDLSIAPPAHTCASACAKDSEGEAHVADTDGDAFLSMHVQDDAQQGGTATAAQMEACRQALIAAQEKEERLALEAEREDSKRHAFPLHPRMHSPCTNATLAMLRGAREERAQTWMARITAAAELQQSARHVPASIEEGALPRKRNESDAQLVLRITEAYQQEMQLGSFHFHDIWGDHDHAVHLRARYYVVHARPPNEARSRPTAPRRRSFRVRTLARRSGKQATPPKARGGRVRGGSGVPRDAVRHGTALNVAPTKHVRPRGTRGARNALSRRVHRDRRVAHHASGKRRRGERQARDGQDNAGGSIRAPQQSGSHGARWHPAHPT